MASSISSPEWGRFPGRFPSPTSSRETTPPPHTPEAYGSRTTTPSGRSPIDYTASALHSQRPIFSETQSAPRLPVSQGQPQQQLAQVPGHASPSSPLLQRPVKNRSVSESTHNRARNSSSGRAQRRPQPSDPVPRNESPEPTAMPTTPPRQTSPSSTTEKTAQQVHDVLQKRLCQDLPSKSKSERGVLYVVRDPARPHLVKIGCTEKYHERKQQIERECGLHLETRWITNEVENFRRAESLAHDDLSDSIRPYRCEKCNKEHGEWHEVSPDIAIETVKRWVDFMREEKPYDAMGKLKPIWEYLVDKRRLVFSAQNTLDHEFRRKYWTKILLPPSSIDYGRLMIDEVVKHPVWIYLWDFSWQVSSVLSWMVNCFVLRNGYVICILGVCVAGALVSVTSTVPQKKRGKKA